MIMAEEGEKRKKKFSALLCGQELERIEQMSIDGSHYSLSNEVLPSLGARSNRRVKLRGFIVSPYDHRYRTWETFLVLLVLYTAWVSPFELGFLDIPDRALAIADNVVNAFFFVDIVLTFFVAYLDKNTYLLVDDHKDIAKRYASTWLVFDVISTIPTELAMKVLPQSLQTAGLFNMLRLWRVRRISALFARLEKDRNFNYFWVRVVKLIVVILFYVHCASCFYNFLTNQYPDPSKTWIATYMPDYATASVWRVYITTFYFAITTVTTTGYGDLHPVNSWEMIFDIFFMLLNLGLNAYLIGNMTNLIVHGTSRTRKFRDTIQAASSFAHRNQLPVRLQDQMLAHLCLKFRIDSEGLQQQETFDSLPKAIRSSISHFLFYSLVDKAYLFRGVSSDLLFQLVSEMKAEYFPPKEDVILQNEAPTDFYILVNGTVVTTKLLSVFFCYGGSGLPTPKISGMGFDDDDGGSGLKHPYFVTDLSSFVQDLVLLKNGVEQIVGELRTGDLCGEIGVLCYRPQLFTVRTKRLSQLLRLNRTSFLNIIQANVGDGNIIMNNLLQHMKELNDLMMDGVLLETENMLARGRMDLPLSLCFAAIRGDDLLLHQLLRRGLDPNEADHGKRTPMHIAACNGNESCVMLLLDYGADPNRRDAEGNVSLWEAIVGGHEKVKKLLVNNGATLVSGDIGRFACSAAEQNNLELLKEAVHYGVDVRQPKSDGTTALHAAVNEGNIDVVKFLLDQGANIDHADIHGWTPRSLADQQAHEEIKALFFAIQESGHQASISIPDVKSKPLEKFKSEPSMRLVTQDGTTTPSRKEADLSGSQRRRKTKNFENSLFGIMSAANTGERPSLTSMSSITGQTYLGYSARVIISCPEKSGSTKKLVVLPPSLQELLELGSRKFDIVATKVVMEEDKAEIDDIVLIRDGDHLVLLADSGATPSSFGVGVRFSLS